MSEQREVEEIVKASTTSVEIPSHIIEAKNLDRQVITPEELRARDKNQREENERLREEMTRRRSVDREIRSDQWRSATPDMFKPAVFDDLPEELRSACLTWLEKPDEEKWTLIIFGATGVGKTFVAYAVLRELFLERVEVQIEHVKKLADKLKPSDNSAEILQQVCEVEALCLDDLGSEQDTNWNNDRLDLIVDHRWQWQLPTIITTNIPPKAFGERFGARTASRLIGGSTLVQVTGKDRRLNGA